MEHSVEKLPGNKVKISFKAPAEAFEAAIEKAYIKNRGKINVPGFRKGRAPRGLIERMFGEGVFYEDALEMLFPDAYMEAVNELELNPVSRPELDVQVMEKGKDLEFSCEVYVIPEVKLGEYKGLGITRKTRKISDTELNARIAQEQKRVARSIDVEDRGVENGDNVNIDYSGSVDGEKFDGGTAEAQSLLIGSGSFIPGFEEQLIGMNIGEERDISVKFPDEYHAENLKGKDAVFHIKLNGITREELPELDDEFASEVSEFDTFEEYKSDILKSMQDAADKEADAAARQAMIDKAVENAELELPEPMIEDKLDEMMEQMEWRMKQQGFTLEKYIELTGQTEQQMRDMYRSEAVKDLRTELVIEEILKAEKPEADEAEIEKMLSEYADAMGRPLEKLKEELTDSQKDYFKHRAEINKALDIMWDSAKISDEEAAKPIEAPEKNEAGME